MQKLLLKERVPTRRPHLVRVPMRADEVALYDRIEEYISHFYQKYENERRGLGFVMTVYRRRLTSSFYAVRCSLERRLKFLRGLIEPSDAFDDDDLECYAAERAPAFLASITRARQQVQQGHTRSHQELKQELGVD